MSSGAVKFEMQETASYDVTIPRDVWDKAFAELQADLGYSDDEAAEAITYQDVVVHLEETAPDEIEMEKGEVFDREYYD